MKKLSWKKNLSLIAAVVALVTAPMAQAAETVGSVSKATDMTSTTLLDTEESSGAQTDSQPSSDKTSSETTEVSATESEISSASETSSEASSAPEQITTTTEVSETTTSESSSDETSESVTESTEDTTSSSTPSLSTLAPAPPAKKQVAPLASRITVDRTTTLQQYGNLDGQQICYQLTDQTTLTTTATTISGFVEVTQKLETSAGLFYQIKQGTITSYVKSSGLTISATFTKANKTLYYTITNNKSTYFNNEALTNALSASKMLGNTYKITGELKTTAGKVHYRLVDNNNRQLGYVLKNTSNTSTKPIGLKQAANGYLANLKKGQKFFATTDLTTTKGKSDAYAGETLKIISKYKHLDGKTYYQLQNAAKKDLGLLVSTTGTFTKNPQGIKQNYKKYVSITKNNYSIWKDFAWRNKVPTKNYYQQTLVTDGKYEHFNGGTYYSLRTNSGAWVGYLNASAVTIAKNQGGIWYKEALYANKKGGNYTLWGNLTFTSKKGTSNSFKTKTVQIKGKYRHFNGSVYYSLYSGGKWLGYINAKGVATTKNRQGTYQKFNKYVTINKQNYPTWTSFTFNKKSTSSPKAQYTYLAKGAYYHINGSTYFSLYNSAGKWLGYMNAQGATVAKNAGGIWQKANLTRKISKKNYSIWRDLSFKQVKTTTTKLYQKQYRVTGQYRHFNGRLYYSLYSGNTWIGYVNATATSSPYTIYSTVNTNLYQIVNSNSGYFYSKADPGSTKKGPKSYIYKKMVRVTKIAKTSDGTYYYATLPGSGTGLGWIKANQTYSVQDSYYLYATGGNFPSLNVSNLNIKVSISKQRVYIRSGSKNIYTMLCSTGLPGSPTPTGNFRIQAEKGAWFWGPSGGAAYYRSFHGHGVYLFHTVCTTGPGRIGSYYHPEAMKLGYRASHGCIRLAVADAIWFYNNMPYNTPVSIVN
ncbi:MAG TPA: L,D-transpeptidase family protein [Candidatus Enterococcus stercoravium]|nr:L,D-transpeptidase family protein [Candidatus Enterococcus stercoravium]